jgi:preprotein translocase YajC subunit
MGILLLAAGSAPAKKGSSPVFFIVLLVAFGLIYFLVLRPRRARMMAAQQQRGSDLTPGQRVRTTAGIYGTVTLVDGTDVEVEIAPGVEVRMLRQAIAAVIPDEEPEDQFDSDASAADGEHDAEPDAGSEDDVTDAEPEAGAEDDAGDEPAGDKDPQDHTP